MTENPKQKTKEKNLIFSNHWQEIIENFIVDENNEFDWRDFKILVTLQERFLVP